MRTSLAVIAVLAAAGALAVATAGAPFSDQLEDSEITLENASGPNGVYAVEQNGELAIRITEARQELAADGVNPGAVTVIEDIFRITYGGNESAEVWIETGVEDVEFRTEARSIEGPENSVRLGTGESDRSVLVGLRIDTTGDHDVETIEEFTVNANVTDATSATTGSDTGGTNAAIGGGDDTVGDSDDTPSRDEPGDSGEPGDTSDERDGQTTSDDGGENGGDQQDGEETTPDDESGDDQPDDQTGETDEDGPDTEPESDDGESPTDGNDDGPTAESGDAPTDLSQSGRPAVFEPAQTLGGFLPQLLGLMFAIAAGAGLVAAARAIAGAGGN